MVGMLTHLHHTPRVGPSHHRWARDAVVAAQLGAAALVVVTALEWRGDGGRDVQPGQQGASTGTEVVRTDGASHNRNAGTPITTPASAGSMVPPELATPAELPDGSSIDIAVLRSGEAGTSTSAVGTPIEILGGPVAVRVIDAAFATVASTVVSPGDVARIADLPAGEYRLILSQTTGVSEPTPGIGISAAAARLTDPVQVTAGDVLLVSLQQRPATA